MKAIASISAKRTQPEIQRSFAPAFVGAVKISLRQMQEQNDHDRARAVSMETPQKRTAGYFLNDVGDGRVGVIGGRNIVKREEDSGDGLGNEKKEQNRSENIGPARSAGDGFIERFVQQ